MSLVLLSLIAAIGPLDYLLINRLLGKPLLGWLTFPLMAIGLSAAVGLLFQCGSESASGFGHRVGR